MIRKLVPVTHPCTEFEAAVPEEWYYEDE
jgi:hypothetical protein